MLYLFYSGIQF